MRLAAQAKMGYFPAAPGAISAILTHLVPPADGPVSLIDPCCGEGAALAQLAAGLGATHVYGVELDENRVRRVVWVLFEGYHPSNALTYTYRDSTIKHSGQTWHHRVLPFRMPASETQPETIGARFRAFVRSRGWSLGPDILLGQFTWLVDSPPRNELIVTYIEDRAEDAAADSSTRGTSSAEWPAVLKRFHQRGIASFSVVDYRP